MRGTIPVVLWLLSAAGCADTPTAATENPKTGTQPVQPVESSSPGPEPRDQPPAAPEAAAQADRQAPEEQENPEPAAEKQEAMRSIDEMLLFYPVRFPHGDWEPENLEYEDVWFESEDETQLHGWYCPCEEPRAVVLFAHGNAGNLSHRAWFMGYLQQQLQVSSFIFDYRGYGRSEGTPTAKGILQDGRAACDVLAGKAGVDKSELVLMGRSLGGAVVVPLAVEIDARGLVLQSTFSSMKEVAAHHYPKLSWLVPKEKLNSLSLIDEYDGALLQSHGDADRIVPYESGKKLFAAANDPKQFVTIPGGTHNDAMNEEYFRALEKFVGGLPRE